VDEFLYYTENGCLAEPRRIIVIKTAGEKFPEIIEKEFTPIPDREIAPYSEYEAENNRIDTIIDDAVAKHDNTLDSCDNCIYCYSGTCSVFRNEVKDNFDICQNFVLNINSETVDLSDVPF
jgi:hypothetical protein